ARAGNHPLARNAAAPYIMCWSSVTVAVVWEAFSREGEGRPGSAVPTDRIPVGHDATRMAASPRWKDMP
ncbi:hypothetical protein IIA29_10350, partial [candidate division KSB1 bacterium]|nr:hypothetical protein [candidate division KSB1 bacterium]